MKPAYKPGTLLTPTRRVVAIAPGQHGFGGVALGFEVHCIDRGINPAAVGELVGGCKPGALQQPLPCGMANSHAALDPGAVSRVIEMAWEDRTPFEAIRAQFDLDEAGVIALMRRHLKPGSFRLWRERVQGRATKHAALRTLGVEGVARHRANQRSPKR